MSRGAPSIEHFRYTTLLCLLGCEDLALISVWSPTFLLTLLDDLPLWVDSLCGDLHDGRVRPPDPASEATDRSATLGGAPIHAAHGSC